MHAFDIYRRLRAILAKRTVEQTVWAGAAIVVALVLATGVLADMSGATSSSSTSSTASSVSSTPTTTPLGCPVGDVDCTNQEIGSHACHTFITTGWRVVALPNFIHTTSPGFREYLTPDGTPVAMMSFVYNSDGSLRRVDLTCNGYVTPVRGLEIAGYQYDQLLQAGTESDIPTSLR